MKKTCRKCGRIFVRDECDFCLRERRWNPKRYLKQFSPRLQKDLLNIIYSIPKEELSAIREGRWLVLTGVTGSGKTLYAAKVMLESLRQTFIERTGPVQHRFISVSELFQKLRKEIVVQIDEDLFESYQQVEFLVLDDLGTEKISEWQIDLFYQLINYRYENLLPTIITTNLDSNQLEERFGSRIPSRLNQMGIIKNMGKVDKRLSE